ncbi:MAG: hypothetical protein K5893_02960 [Prevotella sp.]|nr:hypothetical protein [Prevotella sp.]
MIRKKYLHPQTEIFISDLSLPIAVSKGYAVDGGDVIPIEEQGDDDIIIDAKEYGFWDDFIENDKDDDNPQDW